MSDEIPPEYTTNYETFRDIVSSFLIERLIAPLSKPPKPKSKRRSKKFPAPAPTETDDDAEPPSADDLADFTSYIATATFLSPPRPPALQSLTHHAWTDNPTTLQALYPLPLTASHTTPLLQTLDPSIPSSLTAYGLTAPSPTSPDSSPPSNLPPPTELLTPLLTAYITTACTTPPPPPRSTRAAAAACELCARDGINLSYHHLIPHMAWCTARRSGAGGTGRTSCSAWRGVAWLCGACRRFGHRFRGHEVLAREYYTVGRLLGAGEVRRFVGWVGGVGWEGR